jgi:hypothetical protein
MKLAVFEVKQHPVEAGLLEDFDILKTRAEKEAQQEYVIDVGQGGGSGIFASVWLRPATTDNLPTLHVIHYSDDAVSRSVFYYTKAGDSRREEFDSLGEAASFLIEQIKLFRSSQ